MNRMKSIYVAALLSALITPALFGQWNIARFDAQPNRVYTTFGLDPAFVGSIGYGRVLPVMSHNFQLTADAGVATAHVDTRDFRARLGTQTSVAQWRSLHLAGSATFISRGTQNSIYSGFNFGADVSGAIGVYRPRWFAAGEVGKDKAIITHITNSGYYRSTYYPGARDGWYLDAGGTIHHGVAAGVAIGKTELITRFGWQKTEDYNSLLPPMYGTVGLGLAF